LKERQREERDAERRVTARMRDYLECVCVIEREKERERMRQRERETAKCKFEMS
jgi:hypothetical protein